MATKTKDSALLELAELGKSLANAVEQREETSGTLKQILDLVGSLDKEDAKALFRNEAVQRLIETASDELAQSTDDPPGTVYSGMLGGQMVRGFTKKDGYAADLQNKVKSGEVKMVRYTPPGDSKPVIWNGVRRDFVRRRPMWVEDTFIGIYEDSMRAEELAEQHAAWLFKKGTGHLDDAGMVTPRGVQARGTGSSGHYEPGGGMISGRGERGEEEAS